MIMSKIEFNNSLKINNFYLSKEKFIALDKGIFYYLYGEIFSSHSIETVIELMLNGKQENFEKLIGEFSIVVYDSNTDNIYILNDKTGRNIIYYSNHNHFSISDDFWSIVKYNNYTVDDVDEVSLKEHVFFYVSIQHNTILKDLKILPNASYTVVKNKTINIKKYWYFKLEENHFSTEKKYDLLSDSFEKTIKKIKTLNSKSSVYGIGVSGGMDSRLVPYYALKNNMELHSFIIGQEKPNYFFRSNDHLSSDLVVNYFDLKNKKLDFDEYSYEKKNRLDAIYNPIGTSQIFKIPNLDKSDFDILLTGASGFIVGASPFYSSVRNLPIETLIFDKQSSLKLRKRFVRLLKGINYIFGKDFFDTKDRLQTSINGLIDEKEVNKLKNNLSQFLHKIDHLTKTEQLMNYAIGILGQRNKAGSFESLLNHKKNYSLYTTYTLEMMKYLTEDEIYDRKLFESYIRERLPELANIKGQDHKTAIDNITPKSFQKIKSLLEFTIRGQGVMNYHNWAKSTAFTSYLKNTLQQYDYMSKYFDIKKVERLTKRQELNSIIMTNIIKYNEVIYMIDHIEKEFDGLYNDK